MKFHKLNWLDWISFTLSFWFLFYPKPYVILFTILLLFPVIGLIIKGYSKPGIASLITLSTDKKGKTDYETSDFIVLPAIILILRMALDFEIESYFDLLIKGLTGLVLLLLLLGFLYRDLDKSHKKKALVYFIIVANLAIYSVAAVWGINCVYDFSEPRIYKSVVRDKTVYKNKGTSYYLHVEPWSNNSDNNNLRVTEDQYESTIIGDTATIKRKEGLLNIAWHYVE